MATHLHPSYLHSPSHVNISRVSPWVTQRKATTWRALPKLERGATSIKAQGRGFGLTTVSGEKQRQGGDNGDPKRKEEEDEIPEVVFNRMLVRILSFVGGPMASGLVLLFVLNALKEQGIWEPPRWLPFLTLLISFGTSALGIAYGTLSTSWNPEKGGSLLGWEEVQKNWPELWKEEENEEK